LYDCGLYIGRNKKTNAETARTKRVIFSNYLMAKEYLDISGLNGMIMASPCPSGAEQVIGRLRENIKSNYLPGSIVSDDKPYEEGLHGILDDLIDKNSTNVILSYLQLGISRKRVIFDIVDRFEMFFGMAANRMSLYRQLNYNTDRISMDRFINE
jgi:hypothetical protein